MTSNTPISKALYRKASKAKSEAESAESNERLSAIVVEGKRKMYNQRTASTTNTQSTASIPSEPSAIAAVEGDGDSSKYDKKKKNRSQTLKYGDVSEEDEDEENRNSKKNNDDFSLLSLRSYFSFIIFFGTFLVMLIATSKAADFDLKEFIQGKERTLAGEDLRVLLSMINNVRIDPDGKSVHRGVLHAGFKEHVAYL